MLIPFLVVGLSTRLGGVTIGGTSLHKFQQLCSNTAVSVGEKKKKKTAQVLQHLQSQLNSLMAVILQNCCALDLLTAGQGGTCLYWKEECYFYYNQSGLVQETSRKRPQKFMIQDYQGSGGVSISTAWLLPLLGPVMTIFLGLLFGPCLFQLLTKFTSNWLQQF